jgi:hypothetical protein
METEHVEAHRQVKGLGVDLSTNGSTSEEVGEWMSTSRGIVFRLSQELDFAAPCSDHSCDLLAEGILIDHVTELARELEEQRRLWILRGVRNNDQPMHMKRFLHSIALLTRRPVRRLDLVEVPCYRWLVSGPSAAIRDISRLSRRTWCFGEGTDGLNYLLVPC